MYKAPSDHHTANSAAKRSKRAALFFLALAGILIAATIPAPPPADEFIVVLDAGHGGSDPGNLGTGRLKTTEKHVSLDVALKVGEYIKENYSNVRVVYTRKGDTYPSLKDRCDIANNANADLFISIHCNANDNKLATGAETFVMGLHKTEESLKSAMKENASIFLEKDHEKNYGGFDPNNADTYIILSMRENLYLDQSINLAKKVQDQFRTRVGRKDRGVKQAGFWVISYTNMPSVLVELGFLTNSEEEDFLNSEEGKTYLASAIYRAFKDYKDKVDIKNGVAPKDPNTTVDKNNLPIINEPKQPERIIKDATNPGTKATEVIINNESGKTNENGIIYREVKKGIKYQVQILSSPKQLNKNSTDFKGLKQIEEYKQNGVFKYLAGSSASYKEAKINQEKLKEMGFKDAFIVAFEDGQRIDLSKAISLSSN